MRLYLLGQLDALELEQFEERLFSDREFFDQVLDEENDLFDAWARGELSARDKSLFERKFLLNNEKDHRADFARALAHKTGTVRSGLPRERWRTGIVILSLAAVLVLAIIVAALWRDNRALTAEQTKVQRLIWTAGSQVLAVVLEPGELRGGSDAIQVKIPAGAIVVWAQLVVEDPSLAGPVRAEVHGARGATVWSADGLPVSAREGTRVVDVPVPASALRNGENVIVLAPGASYRFMVIR